MKLKKYCYVMLMILVLMIGINRTYALESLSYTKTEFSYNEKEKVTPQVINNSSSDEEKCEVIFGDKDDEKSIRYLVNEILQYPKYIVPILVIGLGTVDLAKAVISGKEDGMKKAQSTFIKRVLIGVVIFLVPVLLDLIMYFIDLVLGNPTTCGI